MPVSKWGRQDTLLELASNDRSNILSALLGSWRETRNLTSVPAKRRGRVSNCKNVGMTGYAKMFVNTYAARSVNINFEPIGGW